MALFSWHRDVFPIAVLWAGVLGLPSDLGPARETQVPLPGNSQNQFGPLKFREDGTFQISIFEDLHFGENAWDAWGPQQDIHSVKVIETVLDAEPNIDLVVLNGDLITGENTFLENSTHYVDQIVAPMLARGLTWASTYGNHDNDFNISAAAILARERLWPNARTTQMVPGPDVGVSNYYLPVYAPESDCPGSYPNPVPFPGPGPLPPPACRPSLLLWFFDSRGGFYFQRQNSTTGARIGQPNWVSPLVAAWFRDTNTALVHSFGGRVIPSLAFVHIPTNASLALQERGVDPHRQPGIDDDVPLAQQAQGWCPDGSNNGSCAYGGQDVAFMQAIADTPGLIAVFSGHDHGDTWCDTWGEGELLPGMEVRGSGVHLCFGQHSGYGGYGSWIRGARQVVVSLEGLRRGGEGGGVLEVDTHVRLESGDVVGAVTLNRTYGQDWYPATPDEHTSLPADGS